MKKLARLSLLLATIMLLILTSCGSGNVKPPFSEVSLGDSEGTVLETYGQTPPSGTCNSGGNYYEYPCNYLNSDGKITINTNSEGTVCNLLWSSDALSADEFDSLVSEIKSSYTKKYGNPSFDSDVGAIWTKNNCVVSLDCVSYMNLNKINISFAKKSSGSGSSSSNSGSAVASSATAYKKGDTISATGYNLTITSVDSTPIFGDYVEADEGEEYFFFGFDLENTSEEEIDIGNFFTVSADNQKCSYISFGTTKYNDFQSASTLDSLAANRSMKRYLAATVPQDWKEIQILCPEGNAVSISREDLGSMSNNSSSSNSTTSNKDTVYGVGDTITRNGLEITLTRAGTTNYVSDGSYSYYEPDDGNTFVILFFSIKNTSDQAQRFNATSVFDVFVDNYSDSFTGFLGTEIEGYDDLSDQSYTDIPKGKSIKGYKVIQAPENFKKIELISRQGTFVIRN